MDVLPQYGIPMNPSDLPGQIYPNIAEKQASGSALIPSYNPQNVSPIDFTEFLNIDEPSGSLNGKGKIQIYSLSDHKIAKNAEFSHFRIC